MLVDAGMLRSGGDESYRAGEHAYDAAAQLSRAPLTAGMFGDFAAADTFRDAISSAHTQHVQTLQTHHETLTTLGDKTYQAAYGFTGTEDTNAKLLRDIW